jgi:uncharacterized protein YkwD
MNNYMGRAVFLAATVVSAAFAAAGCGSATTVSDSAGLRLATEPPAAGPAAVEPTDGRLGDATAVRNDGPLRELSRGGRPDLRPRGGAPRREGVGAGATCANPGLAPAAATLGAIGEATLCLLNGERADHGLAPLRPNAKLAAAATAYAQDLVAGSYFSHTGRDGSHLADRIKRSGYLPRHSAWALGENLAWGTGGLATPGSIMRAWMNSPGHRDNILDPHYREIGIGVVTGNPASPDGLGATYATEFGVIEDGGDEAVEAVASRPQRGARHARKSHKRRRVAARNARRAQRAGKGRSLNGREDRGGRRRGGRRHGRKHARRLKSHGPKARIAI